MFLTLARKTFSMSDEPRLVHVVMRTLKFTRGPATSFPVQAYLSLDDAKQQAGDLTVAFEETMAMELCAFRGQQVKKAGMTAQDFLVSVGMAEFDHEVVTMRLDKLELIEPASAGEVKSDGGIIIPS